MARNDIEMRITADSSGVARGLAPMMKSLDQAQAAAQETEAALDSIGSGITKINLNDAAIENARKEISRLRTEMRTQLMADVNADTSDAQKRIRELQRTIRVLDAEHPKVEVEVEADTSQLAQLRASFEGFSASGAGLGGIVQSLSKLKAGGAGAAAGGAAIAAGIAIIGVQSGAAAGDIESLRLQLDALTQGEGAEALQFLQAWSKQTPFELEDAIDATKRLVAAGVDLQQIPDYLNDIGNVSSALGVPIEEIATVFSQMESKGRPAYEEIQQLAERGIPAWQALADEMGVSVAEVQKLATEGKLTADAIDVLRESLAAKYPDAMADQADTLNGKLSSLRDTLTQTWQAFGTLSLGGLKDGVDILQDLADLLQDFARIYVWAYGQVKEIPFVDVIAKGFENLAWTIGKAKGGMDDFADWVTGTDDDAVTLGDDVKESVLGADDAIQQTTASVEDLQNALRDAASAFGEIGGTVRSRVDFIISKDDLQDEISKAVGEGVQLPAQLKMGGIDNLGDKQQELIGSLSDWVETGLTEGARRAEIDPNFDADEFYRRLRSQLRPLVLDAGIDESNVSDFITRVLGVPKPMKVKPELDDLDYQREVNGITKPKALAISPFLTGDFSGQQSALNSLLYGQAEAPTSTVAINPTVEGADAASAALDEVAKPDGQARDATVKILIDPFSLSTASAIIARLTETETKLIKVHMEENPTGDDLSKPGAVDRMLSSAIGTTKVVMSGGSVGTSSTGNVTRLAPKQVPIKVYLDGAEIANHLDLRAGRLAAVSSIRRRA